LKKWKFLRRDVCELRAGPFGKEVLLSIGDSEILPVLNIENTQIQRGFERLNRLRRTLIQRESDEDPLGIQLPRSVLQRVSLSEILKGSERGGGVQLSRERS
jgi:hypothetical protein